jgi:hypothetical protein
MLAGAQFQIGEVGMTCLEKRRQAAKVFDNHQATPEQLQEARQVLAEPSCHSCKNPLVDYLAIDNILCEKQ